MKIMITGIAGFIGFSLCKKLLQQGHDVVGVDSINDYYDVSLKKSRLSILLDQGLSPSNFHQLDIADSNAMSQVFNRHTFDSVVHLAAQAGVRYSIDNPMAYAQANLVGHLNVLEECRKHQVGHLVYASSSSVYGLNESIPFSVRDSVDHPVSLYAATKKSNELMSHSYSHLYGLPTTGLRFFTVYGPWGRPDMAPFIFTKKIIDGEPIDVNNHGNMWRDFTYIDDIVDGIVGVLGLPPKPNCQWTVETGSPATSSAPFQIFNIGNGKPINLMAFIEAIEGELGIEAKKNLRGMQLGDVYRTYADTKDLCEVTEYQPKVDIQQGVAEFILSYTLLYVDFWLIFCHL
ncbi:NAD-dependent epimerase, partial [Vibrio sp. FNV 38]|nr:NAD-dependent epimerase [Vibrio sp. FNV 38]